MISQNNTADGHYRLHESTTRLCSMVSVVCSRLLSKNTSLSMTRNAVWCLSNLCRGKNPPPEFSKVHLSYTHKLNLIVIEENNQELEFYAGILAVGCEHLDLLRPSIPKYGANKLFCKFYPEKVKFFSLINKNRVKGNETQRLLVTITVIINTNSCAGVCRSPYSSCVNMY